MSTTPRAATLATALALALLGTACGRGETRASGGEVARDSAGADSTRLGPPVGSYRNAADSALSANKAQIDSLKQAGVTPATGIDSAAARGAAASANDSARKIPGRVHMKPRGS